MKCIIKLQYILYSTLDRKFTVMDILDESKRKNASNLAQSTCNPRN